MRTLLLFVLLSALVAGPASAGDGCAAGAEARVQHLFEAADRDGGGTLTRAEYEHAGLQGYGVPFEESDANGDGETTLDEYLDLYRRLHPPADAREA